MQSSWGLYIINNHVALRNNIKNNKKINVTHIILQIQYKAMIIYEKIIFSNTYLEDK